MAGGFYHVTSRGSNREAIYRRPSDRVLFEQLLDRVVERYEWRCHAYCWMTNHYHLVVEIGEKGLSRGMQLLNGGYSRSFNKRHAREAHAFRNRFGSKLIEAEAYFLDACRYVVLNPIRARIVKRPEEWTWSSYRACAGVSPAPSFLTEREVLAFFSADDDAARRAYRTFVQAGIPEAVGPVGYPVGV